MKGLKRVIRLIFFSCIPLFSVRSQELNCVVTLNYNQLFTQQNTDNASLNQLKNVITDFMNARRWTNDNFNPEERINCKLNINLIRSPAQGVYEGTAQLIVSRPVYGTNYETILLNFIDRNFNFNYLPNNPMYYNENTYSDELTQMLAFYAYIILAVDYDSFSKYGGNNFLQRAQQVTNLALGVNPGGAPAGWYATGNDRRNRFWLVDNLNNQLMLPVREGVYNYHRLALDTFNENPTAARTQVMNLLTTLQQTNRELPGSVYINSFFDAKGEELNKILMEASKEDRQKAFAILSQLDPSKTELYRRLLR
ncbi:type IX secretion system protein PorD [Runella slithyformis]|uniref:DUF4835 family protein n=1 Tax=Runella slithyformis (strain ATCC 29530 / DSM 19594 / LMG 11500 / NCIMB 11436 / LSU 4) TaxID=761193 RepID=A0A7U3ZNR2_RUNSL|nr:DUF4835 family protein [Runella slithyformis]AEI50585.1 hypothetical protein Runsl_4242 [Runella slithyformis DSM 19594]